MKPMTPPHDLGPADGAFVTLDGEPLYRIPEYDAMPAFDATRVDLKKATRKAWAHTLGADRWGRSQGRITHAPTPGPGWYDVAGAAARSRRRTALSSSFVSKTERKFLPKGSDAPGPAYYAPRRNRDSSFVLNDTGRWV